MNLPFDPTTNPALPERLPARLAQLAGLFNGRPIRERLLLLAASLALVYGLVDQAWVAPALRRATLTQAASAVTPSDPATTAVRTRELLQRFKAIEQSGVEAAQTARKLAGDASQALQAQAQATVSAEQMPALLRDLMHGRRPCTAAGTGAAAAAAPCRGGPVVRALKSIGEREPFLTDGAGPNGETVTLWRHGVELVLEGSFSELEAYLAALESLPRRLQHGEMRLEVGQYPTATLTLKLYTLSLDKTWLQI